MNVDINMSRVRSQLKASDVVTQKGGCAGHTRRRGAEGIQFDMTNTLSLIFAELKIMIVIQV